MISGIYAILNIVNDKVYVGNASDFRRRFKNHRYYLRNRDHYCQHLQRAYNKYTEYNFIFVVLECVEPIKAKLLERENFWIKELDACNPEKGYNHRLIAESNLGMKVSEETRQKMSKAFKGRKLSEENKRQIALTLTGRKLSEETKRKMSASSARKGKLATNRDFIKWPHELGKNCRCVECMLKKREYLQNYLRARKQVEMEKAI